MNLIFVPDTERREWFHGSTVSNNEYTVVMAGDEIFAMFDYDIIDKN